jgi:hypothetical protein
MAVKHCERRAAQHSADHYRKICNNLVEKGTVKKIHADSTKINIYGVMKKWTRYVKPWRRGICDGGDLTALIGTALSLR